MPTNVLSDFTLGTTIANTDHIVGYTTTGLDGERRWAYQTLKNSISADLATAPSVARAWACFTMRHSVFITLKRRGLI